MASSFAAKLALLAAVGTIGSVRAQSCTFKPNCDYGHGSRSSEPAATQDDCCALCSNRPGCAAGVFSGGDCWFKTAKQVASGCQKSTKVTAACIPPSVKPGPPPAPPPTPPHPKPPPAPPKPPAPPAPPLPPLPPTPPSPQCGTGEKPVQVFIMMGQSNMLGEGKKGPITKNNSLAEAVQTDKKYPYLWSNGNWSTSKNVRNVFVMGSGGQSSSITLFHNEFMTAATTTPTPIPGFNPKSKPTIGPELGIGFALDAYTQDPVMTLKSCIGDRALGWDLLPPGSPEWEYTAPKSNQTYVYAGYHESPAKWLKGQPKPPPIGWAAGIQYDGDLHRATMVLGNFSKFYPGSSCYEVAGFFWWQGDRDSRDMGMSTQYEKNLVSLIKALRLQFNAPNAKFVTASLGQTVEGATDGGGLILDAMENIANPAKYPEFKGNVAAVYTHPLLHTPGSSGGHYGDDAYTYMNVGQAMGAAMVGLLKGSE